MPVGYDADIRERAPDVAMDVTMDGRLLLVVGARRSGTHWIQRILRTHPDVTAIPAETYLFSRGIAPLFDRVQHAARGTSTVGRVYAEPGVIERHVRPLCDEVLGSYLDTELSGATVLLERTPEHVHHIGLVRRLYPGTRFVHVIRDGFEAVRSLLAQPWGPAEPAAAAAEWRDAVAAGRAEADGPGYVEVRYERLDASPRTEIRALFEALGLPASEDVLAAAVDEAGVVANTRGRGRGAGRLDRAGAAAVRRVAGDLLAELGYERDPGGPLGRVGDLLAGLWARLRSGPADVDDGGVPAADHGATGSVHGAQRAADELLEQLRVGDPPAVADLVAPTVELRLVGAGRERTWRGPGEAAAFATALRETGALAAPQEVGAVHTDRNLVTVVTAGVGPAGPVDTTVVVRLGDGGIRSVVAYRHPLT